jgi:hypothetical protein
MGKNDFVNRGCIVDNKTCSLLFKCEKCLKELDDIMKIDEMFRKTFADLLRQSEKIKSTALIEKNDVPK